jgi:hypothetical protein
MPYALGGGGFPFFQLPLQKQPQSLQPSQQNQTKQ